MQQELLEVRMKLFKSNLPTPESTDTKHLDEN